MRSNIFTKLLKATRQNFSNSAADKFYRISFLESKGGSFSATPFILKRKNLIEHQSPHERYSGRQAILKLTFWVCGKYPPTLGGNELGRKMGWKEAHPVLVHDGLHFREEGLEEFPVAP